MNFQRDPEEFLIGIIIFYVKISFLIILNSEEYHLIKLQFINFD